ncbi:MAG: Diaminopimelate decarboxylase [Elusimicrobia bacterium ADurb.Bin231]|nr:MAG: Diaminopimelate decarboxylase [Elusimicrobia bacterium ADurb.Bin231]
MLTYKKNILYMDNSLLNDIADKISTPAYIYSRKKLIENFRKFNGAFSKHNRIICYAVKANANPEILKILAKEGCGCDIVSGGELKLALKCGINPKKIVFAGVGKKDEEIRAALKAGILLFNVESIPELYKINEIAMALGKKAPTGFRVNPDIDAKTHPHITTGMSHNKFGLSLNEAEDGYLLAKTLKNIEISGVHCHIGSQITDPVSFEIASKKISAFINKIEKNSLKLKYIDMGGGLGINYNNDKIIKPKDYAAAITKYLPKNRVIILEPGRFMVAETCILVTKIIFVKKTAKKKFIVVDAGMNDLVRPAIYDAFHKIIPLLKRQGEQHNCDVVGPICESSDVFAKDRKLPPVTSGDYLAILCAGAYGYSMSSNYNMRPRPAEILVEGKNWKVIRKRETLEDILK